MLKRLEYATLTAIYRGILEHFSKTKKDYRLLTWMYVKITFFCNLLFYLLDWRVKKQIKMEYETSVKVRQ